tara:strand:- start:1356 stop:1622 length:267 start_codon:yes stop_codon:yes gene_type:complete
MDFSKSPVLITWNDITSCDAAWMSLEEAMEYKPSPIQTLGWIIEDNEDYIVVIGSVSTEENDKVCGSVCAIPQAVVVSVELLDNQNVC